MQGGRNARVYNIVHVMYCPHNIIRVMKGRRVKLSKYAAGKAKKRIVCRVLVPNLKKNHL